MKKDIFINPSRNIYWFLSLIFTLAFQSLFSQSPSTPPQVNQAKSSQTTEIKKQKKAVIPGFILLANSKVPHGVKLAEEYGKYLQEVWKYPHHRIIKLPMPITEIITEEEYIKQIRDPFVKAFKNREGEPIIERFVVSFFGVPIYMKQKKKIRCVDRMLSMAFRPGPLPEQLVQNPFFGQKVINYEQAPILFVSRLDAPMQDRADRMIKAWKDARKYGAFRRWLVKNPSERTAELIRSYDLFVNQTQDINDIPYQEIQFIESDDDKMRNFLLKRRQPNFFDGTMVILRDHGLNSPEYSPFRSNGISGSSASIMMGASFFIGRQTPRQEDHLDDFYSDYFIYRFLNGDSFLEAAMRSIRHLNEGVLVIGDPMFRPFGQHQLKEYHELYDAAQTEEESDSRFLTVYKDWWFARQFLNDFNEGRFDQAIAKAKGSVMLRTERYLYYEILAYFLFHTQKDVNLIKFLKGWSQKTHSAWNHTVISRYRDILKKNK